MDTNQTQDKVRGKFAWFKAQEPWLKDHMFSPDVPKQFIIAWNPFQKKKIPPGNFCLQMLVEVVYSNARKTNGALPNLTDNVLCQ